MKASLVVLIASATALFGQALETGTLRGLVLDPSGASVPNAPVTVSNDTKLIVRSTQTGVDGAYLFQSLPPSTYELVVEAAGFSRVVQTNIVLHTAENLRINVDLKPSPVASTLEVTASVVPVNAVNASIDAVIATSDLKEVMLTQPDVLYIAAYLPGAQQDLWHQAGQSLAQNVILVDGSNEGDEGISDWGTRKIDPPPDAIAELHVSQNGYSADLGRASGTRFEMVTKSGTNQFHGSAYWFNRNTMFNARNWGATATSVNRTNEAGYTLGGPAKKQRLYFFFSSYYNRINTPASGFTTWPTQAQLGGDFSAWLNPGAGIKARIVKDPLTGTALPGNMIPASRLNRDALAYLNLYYPSVANPFALSNNGYATSPVLNNDDYYSPRFDFLVTKKLNMFARYTRELHHQTGSYTTIQPGIKYHPDAYIVPGSANGLTLGGTYLISPRFLIDFQSAFFRNVGGRIDLYPGSDSRSNIPGGWNGTLLYPQANPSALPQVNLSSGYTTVARSPGRKVNTYGQANAAANFVLQRERHNFKFGFDDLYRYKRFDDYSTPNIGTFSFDGSATGDALADFLFGKAYSFTQSSTLDRYQGINWEPSIYAQDEIKVNKKLTLTLGLRWEGDSAYRADKLKPPLQAFSNWLPNLYSPAAATPINPTTGVLVGTSNYTNGFQVSTATEPFPKKNFMPRVSIAYAPWGNKTAIRAGYGIFYDHQPGGVTELSTNPPFLYSVTVYHADLDDPSGGQQAPRPLTVAADYVPWQTPRTQKYSAGVQHEWRGMVADVSYSGSRSTHQAYTTNINQPMPNAGVLAGTVAIDSIRPYYGLGGISMTQWGLNGRYNSLQAQLKRPVSKGLFLLASYTHEKATVDGGGTDPRNRAYDAGEVAMHDIFSLAGTYTPSVFANSPLLPRLVLHGWELSTGARLLSGNPLSVSMQTDTAGIGRTVRAQWSGSVSEPQTMHEWFDPTAFSAPAPLTFGNSPVGAIWGPGSVNWDLAMFRNFPIREKVRLQARLEAYNVLNHFNLNNPNTTFGQATFGQVTSKSNSTPRNLQLGLRITF
ncbi:MAG TPA: TonB-dependent receptor [Bryobacteraceae bacterium]|nr:TonB-dependent receptor [Bryobacteraceae bacterium]